MSKLTLKNYKIEKFYKIPEKDLEKTEEYNIDELVLKTVEDIKSEYRRNRVEHIREILGKTDPMEIVTDCED